MANLKFSSDLKDDALFRAGELTDGTSDLDSQALVYLNRAYRGLFRGGTEWNPHSIIWWWLKAEGILTLDSVISSLTVSVTNNSTTATFSSTPAPTVDSDVTGWYLKVTGHPDVFKISSIAAAVATLDSVYTGDTDTAAECKIFKTDYDLASAAMKLIAPMTGYQADRFKIYGMSLHKMDEDYPRGEIQPGMPTRFAMVDENTVRFNRYGSSTEGDIIRVEYDYITRPDDLTDSGSEEPLVPLEFRSILADITTYYLSMDKDETDKANLAGQNALTAIKEMVRENKARWHQMGKLAHIYTRQRGMLDYARKRTETDGLIVG